MVSECGKGWRRELQAWKCSIICHYRPLKRIERMGGCSFPSPVSPNWKNIKTILNYFNIFYSIISLYFLLLWYGSMWSDANKLNWIEFVAVSAAHTHVRLYEIRSPILGYVKTCISAQNRHDFTRSNRGIKTATKCIHHSQRSSDGARTRVEWLRRI